MILCEIYLDLTDEIRADMRAHDLDVDDIDVMIFWPNPPAEFFHPCDDEGPRVWPVTEIEDMLRGPSHNTFTRVKNFLGRDGVVGAAYHA